MNSGGKQVVIISQSHLCRNPRVYKEATALATAGYKVSIITTIYADDLLQQDVELLKGTGIQYLYAADLRHKSYRNMRLRLLRRISVNLVKWLGWQLPSALGYAIRGYFSLINKLPADIYIAHQELPLYIGCQLLRKGKRVAFDIEDWYSEDLLPSAQKQRPIALLKQLERFALKNGTTVYTTSQAMAKALAGAYQTPRPAVIYNTFNGKVANPIRYKDRVDLSRPSLFWFSQTLGPGRGIEILLEALTLVQQPVELHLRGNCSEAYKILLFALMERCTQHQLYLHGLVGADELNERIQEHDIGLALEPNDPPNKNLTASNKLFQYLVNGLPAIISPTLGQLEVARLAAASVFIATGFSADVLAHTINGILASPQIFEQAREALPCVIKFINWNAEQHKLVQLIAQAIEK
ncbi:hypothetical protein GCM10023149_32240 [Mucilaginibacter gynuensis]|uniref:Glycosyltransferase subfamily 4-like N-terminal domain-containing protein n=1 Tax=Mucilaginibacter gynuensis TaxID=1302236 RepID=A0ABP8GR14_9SPHI